MNKEISENTEPNKIPLVLIIVGSCLLAIPAMFGTFYLVIMALSSLNKLNSETFCVFSTLLMPMIGFALLFGYFRSLVTEKYNPFLWFFSGIINLLLSLSIVVSVVSNLGTLNLIKTESLFLLFPIWTLFVAVASFYYFKHSLSVKKVLL